MDKMMNTKLWYADDASNDKYVTCMASMIEQIRSQGVNVACKWLEVTGNLELKKRFTLRRRYWLLTVRLRYAEWVRSEVHVIEVREAIRYLLGTVDDECTLRMYQALDIACYLSLYRISNGRVVPMFKQYHKQLLLIVDDFMGVEHEQTPGKSYIEDCSRVFDIIEDVEKICGSKLYKKQLAYQPDSEVHHSVLQLKSKEERRLESMTIYFSHWVSNGVSCQDGHLIKRIFNAIDSAKHDVDSQLSINADSLFYNGIKNECNGRNKLDKSRHYMIEKLGVDSGYDNNQSFWKLYIELIIKKSLEYVRSGGVVGVTDSLMIRETAYWSFHRKIHDVIHSISGSPKYIKQLIEKKKINSESLLYSVFSTLAMKQVPVFYCEYNIVNSDIINPKLKIHRQNGSLGTLFDELIEQIFSYSTCHQGIGFSLQLPDSLKQNSCVEVACLNTGNQLVLVGISKTFTIDQHCYASSGGVVGGLFDMVGFDFLTDKALIIQDRNGLSDERNQRCSVSFEPCNIVLSRCLVPEVVERTNLQNCRGFVCPKLRNESFAEIVTVAKEA